MSYVLERGYMRQMDFASLASLSRGTLLVYIGCVSRLMSRDLDFSWAARSRGGVGGGDVLSLPRT